MGLKNENFSDYIDNLLQNDNEDVEDILDIVRGDGDERDLEYIKPMRLNHGRGLKVDLDTGVDKSSDIIVSTAHDDSPKIFNQDELLYKVSELGSKTLVGDKADLVINSSGLTLSEYFKHKRAKRERNNVNKIVQAVRSEENVLNENNYRKGYQEQVVKLKGLGKESISESMVREDGKKKPSC